VDYFERVYNTIRLFDILKELASCRYGWGISTHRLATIGFPIQTDFNQAKKRQHRNISCRRTPDLYQTSSSQILHLDIEPDLMGILETGGRLYDWLNFVASGLGERNSGGFQLPLTKQKYF